MLSLTTFLEGLLSALLSYIYVLATLAGFKLATNGKALEIGGASTFFFTLLLGIALSLHGGKNFSQGLLYGLLFGLFLVGLLVSFCSGTHVVTLVWILVASVTASAVVGLTRPEPAK